VLRLARIGSVHEVVEAVNPGEVVQDVLTGCAEQIERTGARVEVAEAFPRVACNHVHLFQILDNLIRNALKFVPKDRTPYIEIGIRDGRANGMGLTSSLEARVLFVRDNGIGIEPADHNRVFEPFERLGQNDASGTGIGLAIVKKITELYQGRVWVESEPGQGSTFCFTLPLYGELTLVKPVGKEISA
jgi:signal transduction histidine kinase